MANTTIQLKKSSAPGSSPSDLANGELAINYADGKLFYKAANGTILSISGSAAQDSFGTVNAAGTLIVADTPGDFLTLIAGSNISIVGDVANDTITISATGGSNGGASVTTSNVAPGSPGNGDLWWNTDLAKLFIYYNDGDSSQWVESTPGYIFSTSDIIAIAAFEQANTTNATAIAAFAKANSALANTSDVSFAGNLYFPTGNVSIGTTTSAVPLNISFDNTNEPTTGGGRIVQFENANTSTAAKTALAFYGKDAGGTLRHGASVLWGKSGNWTNGGNDYASHLSFWTRDNGTTQLERMRIDSAGNVGIGGSPTFKLDVLGNSGTTATVIRAYNANTSATSYAGVDIGTGQGISSAWYAYQGVTTFGTKTANNLSIITNNTERVRIDSSGNVSIGSTSTLFRFSSIQNVASATPSLRLTPQILVKGYGGGTTYHAGIGFAMYEHTDGYWGSGIMAIDDSGSYGSALGFYTSTGAASASPTEKVRITTAGHLLVGTSDSSGSSGIGFKIVASATDPYVAQVCTTSSGDYNTYHLFSTNAGVFRFYVSGAGVVNATSTTISGLSDIRLKENIQDINVGLDAILQLKPRVFDWKPGKGADKKGARGFIAQEFEQVFPDMIGQWLDKPPEGEEPYKSVSADLIPVLVKAIQELNAKVEALSKVN